MDQYGIYVPEKIGLNSLTQGKSSKHIRWKDIHSCKHSYRLFESYLCFYNNKNELLGRTMFNLIEPEKFYKKVQKYADKEHPILKSKQGSSIF